MTFLAFFTFIKTKLSVWQCCNLLIMGYFKITVNELIRIFRAVHKVKNNLLFPFHHSGVLKLPESQWNSRGAWREGDSNYLTLKWAVGGTVDLIPDRTFSYPIPITVEDWAGWRIALTEARCLSPLMPLQPCHSSASAAVCCSSSLTPVWYDWRYEWCQPRGITFPIDSWHSQVTCYISC